jgi:hypothetical protein
MNFNTKTDVNESRFPDIRKYQEITSPDTIYELLGDVIVLDRYRHQDDYATLYERVIDVAVCCWNIHVNPKNPDSDVLQHTPIRFKVKIDDTQTYAIPLNRFMISMAFIRTILPYIDKVDINNFILHKFMSEKDRVQIQNNIVDVLRGNGLTIQQIQEIIARMSLDLKEQTLVFGQADMQIFCAENLFLDHYMESEVVREINNTEYTSDMQTAEIVEENARRYKILEKEMIARGNPFFIDSKYAKIVKPKQMEELYINFSQIPDGKEIVPVIMNGNGFKAGYHDLDVFYGGAIAAKVPDLMNDRWMGDAGYFNRNLMILTYGTISKTVYDCGSRNLIPMTIDETALRMMNGRFYQRTRHDGILRVLHKDDRSLLGKRLWFRSPCTCNLNEDCCHVCYGTIALQVGQLEGGFIYTTELMTSRVSQNILSAKHLLKTDAEKIDFSENFEKWFTLNSSTVYPNDEKKFDIYLRADYYEDISDSLTFYCGKDMEEVRIGHYSDIVVPDDVLSKMKKVEINDVEYLKISSFKVIEGGGELCNITPINISIIARYMNIMKFFTSHASKMDSIEEAVVTLMRLLDGLIPIFSVHGEIIIGHLLRNPEDKVRRPNWLNEDEPYQILPLKTALGASESATTSLAFERAGNQLLQSIFDLRNEINRVGVRAFSDYLFGESTL